MKNKNKEFIDHMRQLYIVINSFPYLTQKFRIEKQVTLQFPRKLIELLQVEVGYETTANKSSSSSSSQKESQLSLRESCLLTLLLCKCCSLFPSLKTQLVPPSLQLIITLFTSISINNIKLKQTIIN